MSVISVVHPAFEIMKSDLNNYENLKVLEKIIRTCYRSEGNITEYSHKKLIQKIIENDHTAMLEHLSITVKFYMSRGETHEMVRHRLCAFAQSSTRYIDYTSGLNVVKPAHIKMSDIKEILDVSAKDYPYFISQVSEENRQRIEEAFLFLNSCRTSFLNYLARIKNGANRSQARGSLCNHTQAELVVTANIREWLHIFTLRDDNAAHQDIRLLINAVRNFFVEKQNNVIFSKSDNLSNLLESTVANNDVFLVVPKEEFLENKDVYRSITIPVS